MKTRVAIYSDFNDRIKAITSVHEDMYSLADMMVFLSEDFNLTESERYRTLWFLSTEQIACVEDFQKHDILEIRPLRNLITKIKIEKGRLGTGLPQEKLPEYLHLHFALDSAGSFTLGATRANVGRLKTIATVYLVPNLTRGAGRKELAPTNGMNSA